MNVFDVCSMHVKRVCVMCVCVCVCVTCHLTSHTYTVECAQTIPSQKKKGLLTIEGFLDCTQSAVLILTSQ